MKWLNDDRVRLVVVGFVAAIVLGGGSARADFTFGEPVNLGPVINSGAREYSHCLSADGLELYFGSNREGGFGSWDLWVTTRATTEEVWGEPKNLGQLVNSPNADGGPTLSSDGLELYFNSSRPGAVGSWDIWVTRRVTRDDPWGQPQNLGPPVNSADVEYNPTLSSDCLELYFAFSPPFSEATGEWEPKLTVATRETRDDPWGTPTILGSTVNNWTCQDTPWISSDGFVLMFTDYYWACSPRPDGFGGTDIWFTRRASNMADWTTPVNLGAPINTAFNEDFPMISVDGSTIYFNSDRCGGFGSHDLWQAPILPVVDFDADGSVGTSDLLAMIGFWGTDERLCDIGPMPWGDGVVDEADLEVLMDYWGQDVTVGKPDLAAHWAFDEAEGTTAHDSAGANDANLLGDPVWQTTGGIIDGALEFDGIDDYVDTPFALNSESFSIFTWVRGGGLNQVIVAPTVGPILLQADHIEGNLMTAFMFYTDDFLFSQTQIIDGQWHHVGLVWDASAMTRTLYVDGVEVAKGTVTKCPYHGSGRLQIGTWDSPSTGLWSGLIDDVRVYKTALSAEQIVDLVQ